MGALAVGPWVGEQKPLGKNPSGGNPNPEMSYLPTPISSLMNFHFSSLIRRWFS